MELFPDLVLMKSIFLILLMVLTTKASVRVHYLHWNTSNPIFRIDNTDHIVDVNQDNLPWEYDQLNIICPVTRGTNPSGRQRTRTSLPEKYIIYNVSKEEYDSCVISQQDPRVVAVCDKPDRELQFTITFRSFSPTPRGLEFHPGQDYYFISTSSRHDLHRRAGGSCSSNNMKVIFKVAESKDYIQKQASVNVPRSSIFISSSTASSLREPNQNQHEYIRPIEDARSFHTGLDQTTKERFDRSDNKNVKVKQEASTLSAGSGAYVTSRQVILINILVLLMLKRWRTLL